MLISEVSLDATFDIRVYYSNVSGMGNGFLDFPIKVAKVVEDGLLIENIKTEEGVPLDFSSDIISIDLYMSTDDKPVVWRKVKISSLENEEGKWKVIRVMSPGIAQNRRSHFRIPVGIYGITSLGEHRKAADVFIKDVSYHGFSFILTGEKLLENGTTIRISLVDNEIGIHATGFIVRHQILTETKTLYGCAVPHTDSSLVSYVNRKQREYLQKESGYSRMRKNKEESS